MHTRVPSGGAPDLEATGSLVERARRGDGDAIDALCRRYLPRMRRWAHGRLPQRARGLLDTDDVVSAALADGMRGLGRFEARWDGAFHAFLREVLRNRLIDAVRRVDRQPAAQELAEELVDPAPSPLEEAAGRETARRYEEALARLRPEEREAIVGRVEMGCSYAELAGLLGKVSPDAARMAVARALVRLAEEMRHGR